MGLLLGLTAGFFEGFEETNGAFTLPKGGLGVALDNNVGTVLSFIVGLAVGETLGTTLGLALGDDEGTEVGIIV